MSRPVFLGRPRREANEGGGERSVLVSSGRGAQVERGSESMDTLRREFAYPFAVVRLERNWSAGALQWQAALTAEAREDLDRLMAEQVALYLHDRELEGRTPEAPKDEAELELSAYRDSGLHFEVVYVRPAPLSAFAVAIAEALRDEGISQAELARRMKVPPSVVSRITDPLYFGHTSRTLRGVAEALGRVLHVRLEPPPRKERGWPREHHV